MAEYTPLHADHAKLRKVFARLDANDESGQQVAFNIAGRALKEMGLTWSDLLEAHIAPKAIRSDNLRPAPGASRAFADIFDGIFNAPGAPFGPRTTEKPRPRRTFVDGKDAPRSLYGKISIIDERTTRSGGTMLVVNLEDSDNCCYGPFAIFDEVDIGFAKNMPEDLWHVTVRQPRPSGYNAGHMPTLTGLHRS